MDLRNTQLVTQVFESQNRLDPKKQQFLKTFQKFAEKKGKTDGTSTRRMLLPKISVIPKEPTTRNI